MCAGRDQCHTQSAYFLQQCFPGMCQLCQGAYHMRLVLQGRDACCLGQGIDVPGRTDQSQCMHHFWMTHGIPQTYPGERLGLGHGPQHEQVVSRGGEYRGGPCSKGQIRLIDYEERPGQCLSPGSNDLHCQIRAGGIVRIAQKDYPGHEPLQGLLHHCWIDLESLHRLCRAVVDSVLP